MQLSGKQTTFSEFFLEFLKSSSNFAHFQKKDDSHSSVFQKLWSPKKKVSSISIKSHFKGSFKKQHGKLAQTLLKFSWQNLDHI